MKKLTASSRRSLEKNVVFDLVITSDILREVLREICLIFRHDEYMQKGFFETLVKVERRILVKFKHLVVFCGSRGQESS